MRIAASFVLGLFLGFVGAMVQTYVVRIGTTPIPVGAVLVLIALVLAARACGWWVGSRWGASLFSAGWLVATFTMATTSPGGDLVITSGTRQLAYLIVGATILAAASGFPLLPGHDEPAPAERQPVSHDA